jgi:hypothetical protein
VTFDDLAMDGVTRSGPRAADAPASAQPAVRPVPVDAASALTAHQVGRLQRTLGNRATTILIARSRLSGTASDLTQVQRAKPGQSPKNKGRVVLPGRSKRNRAAQEDELAAMDQANAAWDARHGGEQADPSRNPFSALPVEQPGATRPATRPAPPRTVAQPAPTGPVKPTITALNAAIGDVPKLRGLLQPFYGVDVAGAMSRMLRSTRKFTTIDSLEKAVAYKATEQARRDEAPAPTSAPGGSLNTRTGKPVSGLSKGKGSGFKAGVPAAWHVHFDHVKYGSNGASRVNFPGRPGATITTDVTAALLLTTDRNGYDACRAWMNANVGTTL